MTSRSLTRGRRATLAAAFTCFVSLLLPSVPAQATTAGFHLRLHDSFVGGVNTNRWGLYDGRPSGTSYSVWSPRHVIGQRESALLRGYREGSTFTTGGMMLKGMAQTYGRYLVRARFDRNAAVAEAMMLWPVKGWPPELDFSEGPTSRGNMATAHWSSSNTQAHAFSNVDMTQWHTYGVEWTPSSVLFTVDGHGYSRMTGAAVPHQPMSLAVQTIAVKPVPAGTPEVRMTIADVYVWSYS